MRTYASSRVKRKSFYRKSELQMFLLISGGHIGAPKRCTNMASPYKADKVAWNVSANNSETVGHKDLRRGQIVYTLVFYNISFSWLLPLEDFQFLFFVAWQWKRSIRHFCSHRREPLTWHMQGRILTEKSGTAEPSMFQGVSLKLRISLSCLRFFFNQRKLRTNCFFGVTGVGPFSSVGSWGDDGDWFRVSIKNGGYIVAVLCNVVVFLQTDIASLSFQGRWRTPKKFKYDREHDDKLCFADIENQMFCPLSNKHFLLQSIQTTGFSC